MVQKKETATYPKTMGGMKVALDGFRTRAEQLSKERDEAKAGLKQTNELNNDLFAQVNALEEQIEHKNGVIGELNRTNDTKMNQIQSLNAQVETLKDDLQNHRVEIACLRAQVQTAQDVAMATAFGTAQGLTRSVGNRKLMGGEQR